MIVFLIILILLGIVFMFFLFEKSKKLKTEHSMNMEALHDTFVDLKWNQKILINNVKIATDFQSNYRIMIKKMGVEVVSLQKVFIEILSN